MRLPNVERLRALAPRACFEVGFGVVTAATAAPLFAARHLPLQDLPQHMAAISVLRRLLFGSSLDAWFEPTLSRTQYLLVYALGIPLSVPLGVVGATRLLAALCVVSIPYALRFALKRYGGDERLAALAWPLAWNPQMMLGFLNLMAGVPLALAALGLYADADRRRAWTRQCLLAALALGAFYAHLIPFGVLGLGVLLQLRAPAAAEKVSARASPREVARALAVDARHAVRDTLFLIPACVAALVWVLRTPAADASVRAGGVGVAPRPVWPDPASLPRELSSTLLDFPGDFDERALVGLGLAFMAAVALAAAGERGDRERSPRTWALAAVPAVFALAYLVRHAAFAWLWGREAPEPETWGGVLSRASVALSLGCFAALALVGWRGDSRDDDRGAARLAWLPVCCAVLYLTTPTSYGWIWPIHTRFAVVSALLLALLVGRRMPARGGWLPVALAAAVSVAFARDVGARFAQWDQAELGDLDEALDRARPNRALVAILPVSGSGTVPNVPLLHAAAWYQVRGGAVATFSFADFPQSPFRYREGAHRPPRLPPRWEWGANLDVADPSRDFYDYVLVRRGGHDPVAGDGRYRSVYDGRLWRLYERSRDGGAS